jgi:hypothetical protein
MKSFFSEMKGCFDNIQSSRYLISSMSAWIAAFKASTFSVVVDHRMHFPGKEMCLQPGRSKALADS